MNKLIIHASAENVSQIKELLKELGDVAYNVTIEVSYQPNAEIRASVNGAALFEKIESYLKERQDGK